MIIQGAPNLDSVRLAYMESWNKRLARALNEKGMSKSELARQARVSPATVTDWINGKIKTLEAGNLLRICRALEIDPMWLMTGRNAAVTSMLREKKGTHNVELGPSLTRRIPLISWTTAGKWAEIVDNLQPGDAEDWIPTTASVGSKAFALRVCGDSMEPTIPDGATIIVDPDRSPKHGDIVVVRQNDDTEATCKRLVYDGGRPYLRPDNPRYPLMEMAPDAVVVGVVVAMEKLF